MLVLPPDVRICAPVEAGAITLFPLQSDSGSSFAYRLADELMAEEQLLVGEVDESGSVPILVVENRSSDYVLFLEGEELIGAKQNRVLNATVLIGPNEKRMINVSCVEQGRWNRRSLHFRHSGHGSPISLRRRLKKSVTESMRRSGQAYSDQVGVWNQIAQMYASSRSRSRTSAMAELYDQHRERITAIVDKLDYVEGATGVAVAIGSDIQSCDLFDKAETCRKAWKRLVSPAVLERLLLEVEERRPSVEDLQSLLEDMRRASWEPFPTIGLGQEYRATTAEGHCGSALAFDDCILHCSIVFEPQPKRTRRQQSEQG